MKTNSSQPSKQSISPQLLKTAEYASLGATVLGTVVSTVSQQAVYAIAPLSLSLCLSLLNRQRIQKDTEQQVMAAISLVEQRLGQLDRKLLKVHSQVLIVAQSATHQTEEKSHTATVPDEVVREDIETYFSQITSSLAEEIQGLRQQLLSLTDSIAPEAFRAVQQTLLELQSQTANLTSLNAGDQLAELRVSAAKSEQLQSKLTARLDQLEGKLVQSPLVLPGHQDVQQQIQQLSQVVELIQQTTVQLQSRLTELESLNALEQLSTLESTSNLTSQSIARLQERLAEIEALRLSEQLLTLQEAIDKLPRSSSDLISQTIAQLQGRLDQLESLKLPERISHWQEAAAKSAESILEIADYRLEDKLSRWSNDFSAKLRALEKQLKAKPRETELFQSVQQLLTDFESRLAVLEDLLVLQNKSEHESIPAGSDFLALDRIELLENQLSQLTEIVLSELQIFQQQLQDPDTDLAMFKAFKRAIADLKQRLDDIQTEFLHLIDCLPNFSVISRPESLETYETVDTLPKSSSSDEADLDLLLLNLGIDFGTGYTKVCFRDIGQDQSEIVSFSQERPRVEEALLPTKIGILPDGKLLAGLTASEWATYEPEMQTVVEFIKMRLAGLDISSQDNGWRLDNLKELNDPETVENLCAYYLYQVVHRAQSWIRHNRSELITKRKIEWSANIGVPVAYCDSPALARFEKVLALAWLLSNEPQTEVMTLQNLNRRMKVFRDQLGKHAIDCHAFPEIAAEVWSFVNSRQVDEGFYIFFDIGDGTLDAGSFRYWDDDGEKKVHFLMGEVEPLGVSALSKLLSSELNVSREDTRETICGSTRKYIDQCLKSQSRKQVQQLVGKVVVRSGEEYEQHSPALKQQDFRSGLNVFICGGGSQTAFYCQTITSTHRDFQQDRAGIPEYKRLSVPIPRDLRLNGIPEREFHRFAVAYGLSIPDGELPEIKLPSEMAQCKPKRINQPSVEPGLRYDDLRGSF